MITVVFHITHKHTPETCPVGDPELVHNTWGKVFEIAEQSDVKIHGAWTVPEAHTAYLIVETDSAEAIAAIMRPVMKIGVAQISPVTDARAQVAAYAKEEAA